MAAPLADAGEFAPGTLLAGRYRIVALLGRGGMGQVYRAEDLKLGQPVALKFLPERLARDGAALARFHGEVRIARQISHPGVCRVFDIGEFGGQPFLCMEYIDGEDLASLLRRIGRLPSDKALELARQLCAGLAAAHEAGVLHRDLKPANVMIDGRGRARIADFGLAGLETEIAGADIASGTPAYMAPEQLAGRAVTRRSDIYALGLVLYEIFTGHRVFDAATLAELRRQREAARLAPSRLIKDLDPQVERIILRCLEEDPARRPATVLQVAAGLPGGDPLNAALLAGETPSPEMVAAAPAAGALSPRAALACFGGVLVLMLVLCVGDRVNLHHVVPLETAPDVLADRAAALVASLGYPERPRARARGFGLDQAYFGWEADPIPAPLRWQRLATGQPLTVYFWYRQSPHHLTPRRSGTDAGRVSLEDPAADIAGMASVVMDPRGRLVRFDAVPEAALAAASRSVDWTPLFVAAGLARARFEDAPPQWTPPVYADTIAAWTGALADHPDITVRVEAAACRGRAVHFQVVAPWQAPPSAIAGGVEPSLWAASALIIGFVATVLLGALLLARENLRLGRGDRAGAFKLAGWAFALRLLQVGVGSDVSWTPDGVIGFLFTAAHSALLTAAVLWLMYVALEPYIRRNRPELIISWTRLLAGEWRDPMIGRDLLIGALLGLAGSATVCLSGWLKRWSLHPLGPNRIVDLDTLGGVRHVLELLLDRAVGGFWATLACLVFLALARRLLRSETRAAVALWLVLCAVAILVAARSWPAMLSVATCSALMLVAMARFGLVAGIAFFLFSGATMALALTTDPSAFYADGMLVALGVLVAIAAHGFRSALGGQRLLADDSLD